MQICCEGGGGGKTQFYGLDYFIIVVFKTFIIKWNIYNQILQITQNSSLTPDL